jgi:carbon-monoxide dehydrogenase medium subunit
MQAFAYARPESLPTALGLLDQGGDRVSVLAGGTDLVIALRHGSADAKLVVDIKSVDGFEPRISADEARVTLSATAVMADVEADTRMRAAFPALAKAAATVGSVQIRNRATLVGNICHASPAADTAPALLAYGARVKIVNASGARLVALSDFFVGPGHTVLERGELAVSIELPTSEQPLRAAFAKVTRRRGVDLSAVSVACVMSAGGETRLGCGAVGPRPFVVVDRSGVLADPGASDAAKGEVLEELLLEASPISDVRASREYRAAMLRVVSLRLIRACLDQSARGGGISG